MNSRKEDFKLQMVAVDLGSPQLALLGVWSVDQLLQIPWELVKNAAFMVFNSLGLGWDPEILILNFSR